MILHDCNHLNRLEHGDYALCFDCGAERHPQIAPAPLPTIPEQRLARVSERVFGVSSTATVPETERSAMAASAGSGVACAACGGLFGSLHALIAHTASVHRLEAAGGR